MRAADPATAQAEMRVYYDRRAPEYDEWYEAQGRFAGLSRPDWDREVDEVRRALEALLPARTLDVACGTGYLTRHLPGYVVGQDQSRAMVDIAQRRLPRGLAVVGDALDLPFADGTFARIVSGHFYGHLLPDQRAAFLAEARRVGRSLLIVDSARREGVPDEEWQERILNDSSRHRVFKRCFDPHELLSELDGGRVLIGGRWFVVVESGSS